MTKLFVLYKRTYGDFDISHDEPVYASSTKEHLKIECAFLNDRRSKDDLDKEVEYWTSDKAILRLL